MLSTNGLAQALIANIFMCGETSRSLSEWVKEHSKDNTCSAIYQHCTSKGHPLPNIDQFKVLDQEMFQVPHEAKEAICIHLKVRSRT